MRQKPPNRRESCLFDMRFKGIDWTISYSLLDGRPGEVFIHGGRSGSDLDAIRYATGVLLSHLFQRGVTPEEILPSLPHNEDGSPAEIVGAVLTRLVDKSTT